jgi:membrane-associated protein
MCTRAVRSRHEGSVLGPSQLIVNFGTIGLLVMVFVESGLLVGFFLPGDSLLFTAGLLASQGRLNLAVVVIGSALAAIAGDQVGFGIGRRLGPALFRKPDARLFKRRHLERATKYFETHGNKTIVLARFIPVIRTFTPTVAGASGMRYRSFVMFNAVGGVAWAAGLTIAGYSLGTTVPSIDRYLLPIIAVIVVVSAVPAVLEVVRQRRAPAAEAPI